jgi:hypothetical protein
MLIFFKVSMDSGTEYYFFGGGICHRNSFSIKKSIDVMLFVSFVHSLFYHIHHDV